MNTLRFPAGHETSNASAGAEQPCVRVIVATRCLAWCAGAEEVACGTRGGGPAVLYCAVPSKYQVRDNAADAGAVGTMFVD